MSFLKKNFGKAGFSRKKFALALGGGGARGLAHIGVLSVLEDKGLLPSFVVGTSMGAIIGGAYCSGFYRSSKDMLVAFKRLAESRIAEEFGIEEIYRSSLSLRSIYTKLAALQRMLRKGYVFPSSLLRRVISYIIPDIQIEECRIPFAAVSLDLKSGKKVVLESGSLLDAVVASASIPGIFEPFIYDVFVLVDGGWIENVPYPTAREKGFKEVMIVDVSHPIEDGNFDVANGFSVMLRADACALKKLQSMQLSSARWLIKPEIPSDVMWYHFWRISDIYEIGRAETLRRLSGSFFEF